MVDGAFLRKKVVGNLTRAAACSGDGGDVDADSSSGGFLAYLGGDQVSRVVFVTEKIPA